MVAAALGALLGVVLTLVAERAASFVTPEDPARGFAIVALMTGARLITSLTALGAYYAFVPAGLPPFGFALGVSFIAGLVFEAVKASRLSTSHTPA